MKKTTILIVLILVLQVKGDLPIEDSNVVGAHGYNQYSFSIIADFTLRISGIADSNLTLYIMSNASFINFENQAPFTSYYEEELFDEFEIYMETGTFVDEFIYLILLNSGNSTVLYSLSMVVVEDTTDSVGSTFLITPIVLFVSLSIMKTRSRKQIKIGKL